MLTTAAPQGRRRRGRTGTVGLAVALSSALAAAWAVPAAAIPDDHVNGVTLRTFQLAHDPGAVCQLRDGTTPNVDKLMATIDWETEDDFGLADNFITHALATLTVDADGEYEFRMTNDDGALLYLDDQLVLENDGPQDSTSVETTLDLEAGEHALEIQHYEGGHNQRLVLEWKTPGDSDFAVVPTDVLSTPEEVVRVTDPGTKYCAGDTDGPGDGLPLDSVNPNYELVDLRPEDFEPAVSALDFTEDGDLVVVTSGQVSPGGWQPDPHTGEVYVVDGAADAQGPEDVEYRLVADGLFNPMGVAVVGDSIFVTERDGLTELVPEEDPQDPDRPTYVRSPEHGEDEDGSPTGKFATWEDGDNFHEFAFGLVHDEEYFYLSLSVAIDPGGASTDPQPAEGRGTTLRVDRETGEVERIAGGLRTPNGIGWGGETGDDLFVMDNQGDWLPSSKLVHVEEGRFFNHYTNPPGPFDDQPVTPPAVWVPQNDIGNSPSAPYQLEEGPFAGQLLFGDVTYGGLQRASLEKVEGEYQGAVFRHTAGLEAGVNRVVVGPDGSLYVGGIGEAGNWGEAGKLRYGLQKLVPVAQDGEDVFDMADVSLSEDADGFEISYTQPIAPETAENIAAAYTVTQWRYVPTSNYGGPKVGQEVLAVTDAEVRDDGTTVELTVDGLEPGHVVHIRSPHDPVTFESTGGEQLWNTEAWYTLNTLPGYVAPQDQGYYEAEDAVLAGGSDIDTEHNGFSGAAFVDSITDVGAGLTFEVSVDEAGTYPAGLRYANGPHPEEGDRAMALSVNGEQLEPWELPATQDWQTWNTATRDLELEEGTNTVTLTFEDEHTQGHVNIDLLTVDIVDICSAFEAEEGYTALFDGTLASLDDWNHAGEGAFARHQDCTVRTEGGMGLLWHPDELEDYSLKLDWKMVKDDNGGVFVGFPDPGDDPWVAVDHGYEIQIDATDDDDKTTGAIYTFQGADLEARDEALNPVGQWNSYEIVLEGDNIKVHLNGVLINDFDSEHPDRDLSSGLVGLQNHGGGETVYYRNVQAAALDADQPTVVAPEDVVFTDEDGTENDSYTVPEVEGVAYLVGDQVVDAGTYPGAGTVTVTAQALDGFELAADATTRWSHEFSAEDEDPGGPEEPDDRRTAEFHLSNDWRGSTDVFFMYGRWADEVLIGDWDGDGTDTIAVRRGNQFHVSNAQRGGDADVVFHYGRPGDVILVGDWDGDGTDTFAVRRGSEYHVKNSLSGGAADTVFRYGRADDDVMVGDWDGDTTDTFAVRRGSEYHVKNSLRGGAADAVFHYGRDGDVVLTGDWDGDGTDTFAVRRGFTYHVNNSLRGGDADIVVSFGRDSDEVHVGDWDGDGTDTLGIRRPVE